jgi:di/tricarboxylate transporter
MTIPQIEAIAIVAAMLVMFMTDKLRYDIVAALALLAAVVAGIVPSDQAFRGFSNPVIIIIASVLIVGRAIASSGIIDNAMRRVPARVQSRTVEIAALTACVTFLSSFIKNVGTLAIFIPVATQIARRRGEPLSIYLMPMAFGSLIGGTITLVGTSPNLLISTVRQNLGQPPFQMFDFLPVGLPLSCAAVALIASGWWLLPRDRKGSPAPEDLFSIEHYTTELQIPDKSALLGKSVGELEAMATGELSVASIIRTNRRRIIPTRHFEIAAGDILAVQADPTVVKNLVEAGGLEIVGAQAFEAADKDKDDDVGIVEAVILPDSPVVGRTPKGAHLRQRYEVNLLAVRRAGQSIQQRLSSLRLRAGDVIILQGWRSTLPDVLAELGCVPLADRSLALGHGRKGWISILILGVAMVLVALRWLPVAFFAAAVFVVLFRQLSLKEVYDAVDWPVIVMLGALIPVGEALEHTKTTDLLASLLSYGATHVPAFVALAMVLVVAMLVTPLMHHAAAVLVMGPVAATLAGNLGLNPDPFLMAVALGASCDFLTPIGHQNNTLVMGLAGYRFGDFWRLGLPLSIMVVALGTPLIIWTWPLH